MKYDQAVKKAKELVRRQGDLKWELGDLALELEPKYGEATLQKFSEEVEVDYATMRRYVAVSRAFPPQSVPRGTNCGWTVFRVLAGHEELYDKIKDGMTVSQAEKLIESSGEWDDALSKLSEGVDKFIHGMSHVYEEDLLTEERLGELVETYGPFIDLIAEWFTTAEGGDVEKATTKLGEALLELQGEDDEGEG